MKCRYKYCNNDNEVKKEDAIKEGSAYYCKDCYNEKILKKRIEEYYLENMPQTTIQILRKVINQLLYTNKYEAEYILHILEKIHINKFKINNPFGLVSYCNEGRNIEAWNKIKINKEYKAMIKTTLETNNEAKVEFTYNGANKKCTDLI